MASDALRVARLPAPGGLNAYYGLLDQELATLGVDYVDDADFSLGWLWRSRRAVRLLHFHWRPDFYYALRRPLSSARGRRRPRLQGARSWLTLLVFVARLAAARALGYRIAWTIHEVYPPETATRPPGAVSRRIDRLAGRVLVRSAAVLFAHDNATRERALRELGPSRVPIEIVPHGPYVGVYPAGRPRIEVRRALGIPDDAFTFLVFGALRPDKRIDLVLDAFRTIDDRSLVLIVAGRPEEPDLQRRVLEAARADPRIHPLLGVVPDELVAELFGAADAAVIGRSEVWTSGSIVLALSLGLPVVAAAVAPNHELLGAGEAGWCFGPCEVGSLREALREAAADPALARLKGQAARRRAEALPSWAEIAMRTARALRRVSDPPSR